MSQSQYIDSNRVVFAEEQKWAVTRAQIEALEPLLEYGERVVVKKIWQIDDFLQGLVTRCYHCHAGDTQVIQDRVVNVYKGAGERFCPFCFGVGFEGGFKPEIYIMHMLARDSYPRDTHVELQKSGFINDNTPQVQFSGYILLNEWDLVTRVQQWDTTFTIPVKEDVRFSCTAIQTHEIRSGKADPDLSKNLVGQTVTLNSLQPEHPYYQVPVTQ